MARFLGGFGNALRPFFKYLGLFVGRRPVSVLSATIVFTLLCGLGLSKLRVEYGSKIWQNESLESFKQRYDIIEPAWPTTYAHSTIIYVAPPSTASDAGVLSSGCLGDLQTAWQSYVTMLPPYCSHTGADCQNASLFTELQKNGIQLQDAVSYLSAQQIAHGGTLPFALSDVVGKTCCGSGIVQAEALMFRFRLVKDRDDSEAFEEKLIDLLDHLDGSPPSGAHPNCPTLQHVYFATSLSWNHAFNEANQRDQKLVGAAVLLMIVYLALVLGRSKNCVNSKILLGFSVMLSVIASLIVAFGVCVIGDVPITQMTFLAIFVLLGVGVDDALIINDAFARTDVSQTYDERLAITLEEVGPSVLLTSATDFAAFFVGITYNIGALRCFCIHSAVAVFAVFVLQCTFFTSCLVLNERRAAAGRCDCCPCVRAPGCAGGGQTDTQPKMKSRCQQRLGDSMVKAMQFMLRPVPGGIITALFVGLLSLSAMFMANHMKKGGDAKDYMPDSHHILDFWDAEKQYFGGSWRASATVYSNLANLNDMPQLQATQAALDAMVTSSYAITPREETWVDAFLAWRANSGQGVASGGLVDSFLKSPAGNEYQGDVLPRGGDMALARASIWYNTPTGIPAKKELTRELRSLYTGAAGGKVEGFVWSGMFMEMDRFDEIDNDILKSLAIALSAIAVTCFILLPPAAALASILSIVFVNIDLMGFLSFWNVNVNLAQAAFLVLALGFSVDYSAHIAEGFNVRLQRPGASQEDTAQLMLETLSTTGMSVCNAGMSTVLATCALSVASTVAYRSMFKNFFLMTAFGLMHGLILLPILLVYATALLRKCGASAEEQLQGKEQRTGEGKFDDNEKGEANETTCGDPEATCDAVGPAVAVSSEVENTEDA